MTTDDENVAPGASPVRLQTMSKSFGRPQPSFALPTVHFPTRRFSWNVNAPGSASPVFRTEKLLVKLPPGATVEAESDSVTEMLTVLTAALEGLQAGASRRSRTL